ncbi:MAG: hypothetical protein EA428_13925, partial [Spirochaetaceae bacterium]
FYSPLLPENTEPVTLSGATIPAATLPVFVAEITVRNCADYPLSVDAACFWPNLLGWKLQQSTTLDRAERSWPGQTHSGNGARAVVGKEAPVADSSANSAVGLTSAAGCVAALQTRQAERPVNDELMGEVAVYSPGPSGRASVEACYKAQGNKIDRPPEQQGHTAAWMEEQFRLHGQLPETNLSWTAHWDEALCSAVSRGDDIPPGESRCFTFVVAFDVPIVRFGDGRRWCRKYTAVFGAEGRSAMQIARYAGEQHQRWRAAIDEWHQAVLGGSPSSERPVHAVRPVRPERPVWPVRPERPVWPRRLSGAMLNELYFINGGGSVWVHRWAAELDTDMAPPRLGPGEHCALLEGYDIGYYYYNTSDLWPYAWYAVWRWWPAFAQNVFGDLLSTVPLEIPDRQMIYRSESMEPLLVAGKIPHDIGAVMEDPWHRLNGYQMRDDCNLWKDHNPAFILSLYLQCHLSGQTPSAKEWAAIRQAGRFMLEQAEAQSGLPLHQAFGDSTWDNLGILGYASYSAGFTVGCLAALTRWAERFGDHDLAAECRGRLEAAQLSLRETLWNGEFYRVCDRGKYADCIMGDGILGLFLAELAGLGDMLGAVEESSLRSHLEAVYRYSFLQYCHGEVGPLLIAAPGRTRFAGDGGDELQVNEVLVGSAWICVAMMQHYGLPAEAQHMATVLADKLYGGQGPHGGPLGRQHGGPALQFRTPAAIDGEGRFRAPMNMRPLSIWFLDLAGGGRGPS